MKFLDSFNLYFDDLKLEIINYNENLYKILENYNYNYYDFKDFKNGKIEYKKIILNQEQKNKLKDIERKVKDYLNEINNFEGSYININKQTIKKYYKIECTMHWFIRFLRKDIEDPNGTKNIVEPGVYEGINLIYKNRNKITQYIDSKIISDGYRVLVKATNKEGYELIFDIDKISKKDYIIKFITQIKGIGNNFKQFSPSEKNINRIIKFDVFEKKNI